MIEALFTTLGVSIAKYLAKAALPQEWQDQLATDLIGWLAQPASRRKTDDVAEAIAQRVEVIYQHLTLPKDSRNAALVAAINTLHHAHTDSEHLIELRLDPARLQRELLAEQPDAARTLNGQENDLYERMVAEACRGIMDAADRTRGYTSALARAQLRRFDDLGVGQQMIEARLDLLAEQLAAWLTGPSEQAARFERIVYRPRITQELDKLEPFGINEGDVSMRHFTMSASFVEPDLLVTGREQIKEHTFLADEPQRQSMRVQESRLPLTAALADAQYLMVTGAAGSGKSTFVQWLAVRAAQGDFPPELTSWNRLVPFFVRLRDFAHSGFPTPKAIVAHLCSQGVDEMPADWASEVLRRGDGLFLVDGMDELQSNQRDKVLKALRELVMYYPLCRFVVTSRPPAVDALAWPEWQEWLRETGFTESSLADMQWPQIVASVERWHDALLSVVAEGDAERQRIIGQNREGAVKLLGRRPALRKLAATPLLCAMICVLYQRQQDQMSSKRLKLYENCINMLLWERDRVPGKRHLPVLHDYPEFEQDQLMNLISYLAYWMMDEGASAVERERIEGVFRQLLPDLGLASELYPRAFSYFKERADLMIEPSKGLMEFRHRSFQEYLAARYAMKHDKVGALASHATEPAWREMIALAAGVNEMPLQSWELLRRLLEQAEAESEPDKKRYLLLLALSGLETCTNLPVAQRTEVVQRARAVFPPLSSEEALMIANGGNHAVQLLTYDPDYPTQIAAWCVEALATIGGEDALQALRAYAQDDRWSVQQAIGDAWSQFEAQRYAEVVLAGCTRLALSAAPLDPARLRLLPQLKVLTLGNTAVSDLSPLASLASLTQLDLSGTEVSDLSPLASLASLTQLDLRWTAVSDLSPLASLASLTQLTLGETEVSDLSPLASLASLTQLDLSGTTVSDLSPLASLASLTQLDLGRTAVSDLSPLASLANLTQLTLSGTEVSDLSPLAHLPNLTQLTLWNTAVSDLSLLKHLTSLTQLTLWNTAVSDLSPLASLASLTQLDLGRTAVSDLSPLASLASLTQLDLGRTPVSDLSPLASLASLTQLDLRWTEVSDLSPLASLASLTQLNLGLTAVSDLSPLASLASLTQLTLGETEVSDLSPLASLASLTQLTLGETEVSDLSPLASLASLTQLDLSGTEVSDLSPLAHLPNLTQLVVDSALTPQAVELLSIHRPRGLAIYTDYVGATLYRYLPRTVA